MNGHCERCGPPQAAMSNDHCLEWDPPAGLSAAARWTCTTCGATVIDYRGNVYGSAVDRQCKATGGGS